METFRLRIVDSYPGSVDLTTPDRLTLGEMLQSNSGSKDSIKALRTWILDRSHSILAIGVVCGSFARQIRGDRNYPPSVMFLKLLHVIYVINDVFFNCATATTSGPYTTVLQPAQILSVDVVGGIWPQLPSIIHCAFNAASSESEKEKLWKIITLWESKKFRVPLVCNELRHAMSLPLMTNVAVPLPHLTSPYALNIPPPPPPAFPIAPTIFAPPPSVPSPSLQHFPPPSQFIVPNLQNMSVGSMSNIVRASIKTGRSKYSPIDVTQVNAMVQSVEPGRLEVRIEEYYRSIAGISWDSSSS